MKLTKPTDPPGPAATYTLPVVDGDVDRGGGVAEVKSTEELRCFIAVVFRLYYHLNSFRFIQLFFFL